MKHGKAIAYWVGHFVLFTVFYICASLGICLLISSFAYGGPVPQCQEIVSAEKEQAKKSGLVLILEETKSPTLAAYFWADDKSTYALVIAPNEFRIESGLTKVAECLQPTRLYWVYFGKFPNRAPL